MRETINILLKSNSPERKIAIGFSLGILSLILLSTLALKTLNESSRAQVSVETAHRVRMALRQLNSHMSDVQNGSRGFTITGEERYLAPLNDGLKQIPGDLNELSALLPKNSVQSAAFSRITESADHMLAGAPNFVNLVRTKGFSAARARMKLGNGVKRMTDTRANMDIIDEEQGRLLNSQMQQRNEEISAIQRTILVTSLLAITLLSTAYFLINIDLTQRKKMQRLLIEESKMAALGKMAGGIAHEINNPLGIIRGKAQILRILSLESSLNFQKVAEASEKIETTVVRIAKIVTGLLTFARDGKHDEMQSVKLDDLLETTLELCQTRFKQNHVELRISKPPSGVEFQCRPVEISQVLVNLLDNAFDAAKSTTTAERPWVEVRVDNEPHQIKISVMDSGSGIPPENRDKIMQPFFSTKEIGKGTGLGLSVSKGIAESHGGSLELRQESPHTCFDLEIPKTSLTHEA